MSDPVHKRAPKSILSSPVSSFNVRYFPESGHGPARIEYLLTAISRLFVFTSTSLNTGRRGVLTDDRRATMF